MFVDKVKIKIKAGNGGDGHISFHQEKFVANGGPNGGDGGKGGSIIFVATESQSTLLDFYYTKHFRAPDGDRGDYRNMSGKSGKDMIIKVPCGTIIRDAASGAIVADLFYDGDSKVIMRGGRGGQGNARFATSRRQAPRFAQKGELTVEREVVLELKTIADVGLVGFPNVGKSTFLSAVSDARPKIANYHFTTLSPNLGVVKYFDNSWVVADIPGLIEGASKGVGLGHSFLRHIERTRLILHVVDISGSEGRDPVDDYKKINKELKEYSKELSALPQIVALNKSDLLLDDAPVKAFKQKVRGVKVFTISGATGSGIKELNAHIAAVLKTLPKPEPVKYEEFEWESGNPNQFEIVRIDGDTFEITGNLVNKIAKNVVFDNVDSMNYFHKLLKSNGIIDALRAFGVRDGDTVVMQDMSFEFVD